jgi:hypothetical protein
MKKPMLLGATGATEMFSDTSHSSEKSSNIVSFKKNLMLAIDTDAINEEFPDGGGE